MIESEIKLAELNDCTVRALAAVTNASYKSAQQFLHTYGRLPNSPFNLVDLLKEKVSWLGHSFEYHIYSLPLRHSISDFVQTHSYGVFLMICPGHSTVIIDGKCYEDGVDGLMVYGYFKVSFKVGA